jgi:hypothetical protein
MQLNRLLGSGDLKQINVTLNMSPPPLARQVFHMANMMLVQVMSAVEMDRVKAKNPRKK